MAGEGGCKCHAWLHIGRRLVIRWFMEQVDIRVAQPIPFFPEDSITIMTTCFSEMLPPPCIKPVPDPSHWSVINVEEPTRFYQRLASPHALIGSPFDFNNTQP